MQVQAENQAYDEINVTPMLDLAYVLLVIFIIMTTASVQGVKVDLPKAKTTASLALVREICMLDQGRPLASLALVAPAHRPLGRSHVRGHERGLRRRSEPGAASPSGRRPARRHRR